MYTILTDFSFPVLGGADSLLLSFLTFTLIESDDFFAFPRILSEELGINATPKI